MLPLKSAGETPQKPAQYKLDRAGLRRWLPLEIAEARSELHRHGIERCTKPRFEEARTEKTSPTSTRVQGIRNVEYTKDI